MKLTDLLKNVTPIENKAVLKGINTSGKPTPRENFISAVKKQIEMATYDNKPPADQEEPTGRRWYKVDGGRAMTFIRYSVKKIKLLPDQTEQDEALLVGKTYDALIKFYQGLIAVAENGELDTVLNEAAATMMKERRISRERNKLEKEKEKQAEMRLAEEAE